MARNTDIKLPILCDGQSQTTLCGLILRTQCGAQPMFHQPLMRVALHGSQVWIVPIVRGKWCYDAIARIPRWWLLKLRSSPCNGLASASSCQWSSEIISAKSIDKSIGKSIAVTFRERIAIGIVDTFDKKYRYRYRRCYLKVSLTTLQKWQTFVVRTFWKLPREEVSTISSLFEGL